MKLGTTTLEELKALHTLSKGEPFHDNAYKLFGTILCNLEPIVAALEAGENLANSLRDYPILGETKAALANKEPPA